MTPADVGSGMIDGGWIYVQAAYALCWITLSGYALSLWLRARPEDR